MEGQDGLGPVPHRVVRQQIDERVCQAVELEETSPSLSFSSFDFDFCMVITCAQYTAMESRKVGLVSQVAHKKAITGHQLIMNTPVIIERRRNWWKATKSLLRATT